MKKYQLHCNAQMIFIVIVEFVQYANDTTQCARSVKRAMIEWDDDDPRNVIKN